MSNAIIARLEVMIKRMQSPDQKVREAFTRIGTILAAQMKINIRQQGLIDTGTLLNSIRYDFTREGNRFGLNIGSYGVKYAASHEFGHKGIVTVRSHTRIISQAFGKRIDPMAIQVRSHTMKMNMRKRPYVVPAVNKHKSQIIDLIRAAYMGASNG